VFELTADVFSQSFLTLAAPGLDLCEVFVNRQAGHVPWSHLESTIVCMIVRATTY
jgi:hypothetical protein